MRLPLGAVTPERALLVLVLGLGLALRLVHIEYGLPYVPFNSDEESHFASRSVAMLEGGGFDPHYYGNPSAFTYLVFLALRALYVPILGVGPLIGLDQGSPTAQFHTDPTPIWVTARSIAAILGVLAAGAAYMVGKRLWGPAEGLVAAAVLSFAFLPVAYSRAALTDIGSLLPVTVAVYGAVRICDRGARRDYLLTGIAIGLAVGFKYSNGVLVLALVAAMIARLRRDRGGRPALRSAVTGGALALTASALAFVLTTPYFLLEFKEATGAVSGQRKSTAEQHRYGQVPTSGFVFYLKSLGWGLGWGALAAALVGAAVEMRRNASRAVVILAFPIVLFLVVASGAAHFSRYFLPAYPVLALLAGVGIVRVAGLLPSRRLVPIAAIVLTTAVLVQPLAADIRVARLLGRTDTRVVARDFLVTRYPPRLRAVLEPAVPAVSGPYFTTDRRNRAAEPQFVTGFVVELLQALRARGLPGPSGLHRPEVIDVYRQTGFCVVMALSLARGRAENERDRPALAYYQRLEREGTLLFSASPYRRPGDRLQFDFDLSYLYYPSEYVRPGPEVQIYRLRHCRQGFGDVQMNPRMIEPILRAARARG